MIKGTAYRLAAALAFAQVVVLCSAVSAQPHPAPDKRSSPTIEQKQLVVVPAVEPEYSSLFADFDAGFNSGRGMSDADNTKGSLAWLQSYQMLAYMRQYQATSETRWLAKLADQFDRVLECRDDKLGRVDVHAGKPLKGWGTATYDKAGWHVFVVHTGMICQSPAEFVRAVKDQPTLAHEFGTTATRFLAELEAMVADADPYFKSNAAGEGWYEDAGMGIVPLNMSNAMGSVLVELYHVTGKTQYRDKAQHLATYFKNCLRDNGEGGYNWAYWPKTSQGTISRGEDISHASLNVDFAGRCAGAGIVFTVSDMDRFARTWLSRVKRTDGGWNAFVDGTTNEKIDAYVPQANGRWLTILPYLSASSARALYEDVARAFSGQKITMPSRALGIANLGLYGS